ncbi:type VI secretion system tube protein TssD [Aquimarina muelleri]|uniref:type VI secretion system tube protein TssD n=1 Tax=Aquimarina muelleri TaxID=279356 RepID=UPI003F686D16
MGYVAKLKVFGREWEVQNVEVVYHRFMNPKTGRAGEEPMGGFIYLTLLSGYDDEVLVWWMTHSEEGELCKLTQGELSFYKDSFDTPVQFAYSFNDAALVQYKEAFSNQGETPMTIDLVISPAIQQFRGQTHIKHWQENWVKPIEQLPYQAKEESVEPEIVQVDWVDEDKKSITEILYTKKASIQAQLKNTKGGDVKVTITKKDGSEFEKNKKEFIFSKTATDGLVEFPVFEIKEQWEEFKTEDIDELIARVEHSGASKRSGTLQIIPKPKLVAHFRPITNWNGEKYGFDWIRIGDSGLTGDTLATSYKNIIGHYYYTPSGGTKRLATDGEIASNAATFVSEQTEFDTYKKDFNPTTIPWKLDSAGKPEEYYTPWISILRIPDTHPDYDPTNPDPIIDLTLHIEVKDPAHRIKINYDNTYFEITVPNATIETHGTTDSFIVPNTINVAGTHQLNLTIKNIHTYAKDQNIEVFAEEKQADGTIIEKSVGKLSAYANAKKNRKKTKILLVNAQTNITGIIPADDKMGLDIPNQQPIKDMLKRFLNQALIIPEFEIEKMDLRTNTTFNNKYAPNGTFSPTVVHAELDQAFFFDDPNNPTIENPAKTQYRDYMRIYFIGESCNSGHYGVAEGIVADTCIVYCDGLNDTTAAHELYHAMGLYHSFSNLGTYTYEYGKTDCIMDYSDIATPAIPVIQFYKWQWQVLWTNPKVKNE